MSGTTIKIRSSGGGEFDCYLAMPARDGKQPAIVLAAAVHGVDKDIRDLADEFASHGFIAAAPDLFYRSIPGPLPADDKRSSERAQPRLEKIKAGEADMVDTLAHLRTLPQFNGRAAAMGFCYGGPYAILGPKRLGYDAGISCHGTRLHRLHRRAQGRHRAGLHHLGRPGSRRAARDARRLSPGAGADAERRGAHLPRRAARLHDAVEHQGVQRTDARVHDDARARDPRRPARRRRSASPRVVSSARPRPDTSGSQTVSESRVYGDDGRAATSRSRKLGPARCRALFVRGPPGTRPGPHPRLLYWLTWARGCAQSRASL